MDKLASHIRRTERRANARQTLRREANFGGNQGRKVGRVEPSDRKGTLEQSPEAPEGLETRGKKPEKKRTKDERRKTSKRRDRQRSYNNYNRQRRLGPKGGPRREGTEIRPSHEGGEEQHKVESQGGQETETEKDASKNRKPRRRLVNQQRSETTAHKYTLRRTDSEKKNPAKAGRLRKEKGEKATKTTAGRNRWKEVESRREQKTNQAKQP